MDKDTKLSEFSWNFLYQSYCVSPKPLQIHLCGDCKDLVKRALSHINSQPGVAQEVPFLTSLQILHHYFVDIPACNINNYQL